MKIKISRYDIEDAVFILLLVLVIVGLFAVIYKQPHSQSTPYYKETKTIIDG